MRRAGRRIGAPRTRLLGGVAPGGVAPGGVAPAAWLLAARLLGGAGWDGTGRLWGATAGFGVSPWAATHHATWADGLLTMKARVT